MKKRLLALVLALVMLVGLIGVAAAATYTVEPGDNLSKIAEKIWGDRTKWKDIYDENKDTIKDPNLIYAGQELAIPGEDAEEPSQDSEKKTDTRVATSAVFTQTVNGMVCGYSVDGVDQYYGIPYATAERFMAPERISWEGTKVCWAYGEVCPQWGEVAEQEPFNFMHNQKLMIENEDKCLNLNVLT